MEQEIAEQKAKERIRAAIRDMGEDLYRTVHRTFVGTPEPMPATSAANGVVEGGLTRDHPGAYKRTYTGEEVVALMRSVLRDATRRHVKSHK